MRLRWGIFAVGFALVLPIHGQKKGAEPNADERNATAKKKTLAPLIPSVVNVINQEASHQQADGATDHPKGYFERLFSPENLPNIGLFFVGLAGIIIAICTLRKIRNQADLMERQAKIMDRQADLMAASMTQWVSVTNWRVSIHLRAGPLSPQPKDLLVQFDIVNESNFPLTVDAVIHFFGKLPGATSGALQFREF
jgi:hypothetical protein